VSYHRPGIKIELARKLGLDVPAVRTVFGAKTRPHHDRSAASTVEAVIETPRYDLTWFKLTFGRLGVKAYTKGEHVLRLETTAHNTKDLKVGRAVDKFPAIIAQLAGITERFATALDCVDTGFLTDATLDELPRPAQIGAVRTGGIDLDKPRLRTALYAVLALATAPDGFTVAQFTAKVHTQTGQATYTTRQAAYDLRKLRGKQLIDKPGRTRRYHVPPTAARTITALLTLRDQVIAPILAGVRSPAWDANPRSGPQSTATMRTSASTCRPSSTTSASPPPRPPHRQPLSIGFPQVSRRALNNVVRSASGSSAPDPARPRRESHWVCASTDQNAAGRDAGSREPDRCCSVPS
jgi:hypothetical protein